MTDSSRPDGGPDPVDVSVVFATRNRAPMLACLLERLAALECHGFTWEVVVADSASSDETSRLLADPPEGLPLRSVRVAEPGKNRALNAAIRLTRGRLLVFTDDDVIPPRDWLARLVAAAARWPAVRVFGGRVRLALPPGTPSWVAELPGLAGSLAEYEPLATEGRTEAIPGGPNFAIRADALEGVAYDETIGPDGTVDYSMGSETELLQRLQRSGEAIVYVPDAAVRHIVRPEQLVTDELYRRSFRLGRSYVRTGPEFRGRFVFGGPRWLWRMCLQTALIASAAAPFDRPRSVREWMWHHFYRGRLHEHRLRSAAVGTSP